MLLAPLAFMGGAASGMAFGQHGAALQMEFNMEGEVQVNAAIFGLLRQVSDLEPAWEGFTDRGGRAPGIETIVRGSMRRRFSSEGKPQYPWPNLADATNLDRIRHGYPPAHPMLYRTGWLLDSLILKSHPHHVYEKGRMWMVIGTKVPYAIYHQSPQQPRRKLPRRPFVYIDKMDFTQILSTLRRHLRNIGVGI